MHKQNFNGPEPLDVFLEQYFLDVMTVFKKGPIRGHYL